MSKTHRKSIYDRNKQSLKSLLSAGVMIDNKDLSKNNSGQASRYPLAFFVPRNRLTSQVSDSQSIKHLPPFLGVIRHKFMAMFTKSKPAVYVRKTSQNSPFWVICGAVTIVAESDSEHPIFNSVLLTQKTIGGHNHA